MRVFASSPYYDFEGFVSDDADLDGCFTLTTDDGERYRLNGWLFEIEVTEGEG